MPYVHAVHAVACARYVIAVAELISSPRAGVRGKIIRGHHRVSGDCRGAGLEPSCPFLVTFTRSGRGVLCHRGREYPSPLHTLMYEAVEQEPISP